jgi:hypothetical protein
MIKDAGGIFQRVIEALNGFRTKFGYWPKRLEMEAESLAVLSTQLLTPSGFFLMQSKLTISVCHAPQIVATGNDGHMFDYGTEGWSSPHGHTHSALKWLGLEEHDNNRFAKLPTSDLSATRSRLAWVRQSQRVIRMVSELHRMGYQRLRIMPYDHPNAWRLAVDRAENFSPENGAVFLNHTFSTEAIYSATPHNQPSKGAYFGWQDTSGDNARQLADKFVMRFPLIAESGVGRDWEYAGWLCELIGYLEHGNLLPVTSWENMQGKPEDLRFLPIWDAVGDNTEWVGSESIPAQHALQFPLPPPPPP